MSESHVRAAIDGDQDAFERLVHHHASAVWAVATAIAGDPELGRDVAQEAFVAAWQGLHRLRDPGRFGPWLLEIARNRARDAARRGRRRPAQALSTEPADPSPDVADRLDASAREATVWDALDDLPEADREVLLLVYREECSVRDVSRSLGLTEVAVRKRLSRARARLRDGVEARLGSTVSSAAPSPRTVATGVAAVLSGLTARRAWAARWVAAAAGVVALVGMVGTAGVTGMNQVDYTLSDVPVATHPIERCTPTEACVASVAERTTLPDHVVHAFLAAEDARFFEHGGVDPSAVARAAWHNATGSSGIQGGSTITQQLAKHVIGDRTRSLTRKGLEAMVAWELERRLSKPEILERYLGTVYFGAGATGIEDAAHTYFDTRPAHLGVSEAALLAGLVAAPTARSPFRDPDAARQARTDVIDRMRGEGWVTDAEAQHAHDQPLPRPR